MIEFIERFDATSRVTCHAIDRGFVCEVTNPPLGLRRWLFASLSIITSLGVLFWLLQPFLKTSDGNAAFALGLFFAALFFMVMIAEIYSRRRLGKVLPFTGEELIVEHKDLIFFTPRLSFRPDRVEVQSTWPLLRSGIVVSDSSRSKRCYIAGFTPYYQRFVAAQKLASYFDAEFISARPLTSAETELLEDLSPERLERRPQ